MLEFGKDSLNTRRTLTVGGRKYAYYSLEAAAAALGDVSRLPYSLKVLLENLLRWEDGRTVTVDDVKAVVQWLEKRWSKREIAYRPARVLMQDFTGVPAVVDLAAMRDAMVARGADREEDQPAGPGRPGHRPLGDGRRLRQRGRLRRERPLRVRAQPGALRVPALGAGGLRQLPRGAARNRHLPPGEPGIPGAGRLDRRGPRRGGRLPRHPGRHRQPHHHGQRPVGARLGRRRHRGRGGDAGPADLHADPRGRRLQDDRADEGRRPPPPTWC